MAKPYAVPNNVSGVLASSYVHGTNDHLHLVAIGLFATGGGYVRVYTTDKLHWADLEYTDVSTNDLTGLTLCTGGNVESDAAYTFPAGSIVARIPMGQDVSERIMGPASATDGHFFKADGTTGKLAKAEAITAAELPAASTSAQGAAELADVTDTSAGSDTGRVVTPDGLGGSIYGTKVAVIKVMPETTTLTTGDGKRHFIVPLELNGMNLVSVGAHVYTVATGATLIAIQVRNATDGHDMLSTKITLDASEVDSATAATPAVIDAGEDDVVTGDDIAIDIDAIGNTTPGNGLDVRLGFRMP